MLQFNIARKITVYAGAGGFYYKCDSILPLAKGSANETESVQPWAKTLVGLLGSKLCSNRSYTKVSWLNSNGLENPLSLVQSLKKILFPSQDNSKSEEYRSARWPILSVDK